MFPDFNFMFEIEIELLAVLFFSRYSPFWSNFWFEKKQNDINFRLKMILDLFSQWIHRLSTIEFGSKIENESKLLEAAFQKLRSNKKSR